MTIAVSSPVFNEGNQIPQRFTCDGVDVAPAETPSALVRAGVGVSEMLARLLGPGRSR